jgi:hypothetical protein
MSCIRFSFLSTYLLPVEYLHRYSISFYYISKLKKQSVPKLDSNSSVSQCHQMSILNVTMSPDEFLKCHNVTRLVSSMSPSHNVSIQLEENMYSKRRIVYKTFSRMQKWKFLSLIFYQLSK